MTPEEYQQSLRDRATMSAVLKARASQRPGGSSVPQPSGYQTQDPSSPKPSPTVEPYTPPKPLSADDLGGAPDTGAPSRSYGVNEGDQSMAQPEDNFGAMMMNSKAGPLIDAVRQSRAARALAQAQVEAAPVKSSTFGDAIARGPELPPGATPEETANRASALQKQQQAAQQQKQQQDAALEAMRFVVDVRTGHYTPVMPEEDEPKPSRHDIVVKMTADDPSNPIVLGRGKGVTAASIARLQDPKRAIQPTLHPDYTFKPQHAAVAQALGVQPPQEGAA